MLTHKQRMILQFLADERLDLVSEAYSEHVTKGAPSRFELNLAKLADLGFVDWSGSISDVTITRLGQEELNSKRAR